MTDDALDASIAQWLIRVRPGGEPVSIERAREQTRELNAVALRQLDSRLTPASETDQLISSPAGTIPIRVLRPAGQQPKPTVVHFHGGGWVLGDLDTHLGHARRICVQSFDTRTPVVPQNALSVDENLPDGLIEIAATVYTSFGPYTMVQSRFTLDNARPTISLPDLPFDPYTQSPGTRSLLS